MQKQFKALNALIFGATGAVGRELVKLISASPKWNQIHVVVRKQLQQWSSLSNYSKLKIHKIDNLDKLQSIKDWKYQNIDSVFCCLGSRVRYGQDTFIKVDKTYPLWIADIAKINKIKHYSLVSSAGGDADSWFLYLRTKGEVERDLKLKQLEKLSIFRPGIITNRYEPHFGATFISYLPFMDKIDVTKVAECLMIQAQKVNQGVIKQKINVYNNTNMLQMIQK